MRNEIRKNFSIISNYLINDERISAGAKGVGCYLLSKPDGWQFYMDEIKSNFKDSYNTIKKYIKELEEIGFLSRTRKQDSKGHFVYDYDIDLTIYQKSIDGKSIDGKSIDGKLTANNTNINNTNINNTNINKRNIKEKINLDFIEQEDFKELVNKWINYKKERKEKITQQTLNSLIKNLKLWSNNDIYTMEKIICYSIDNGYSNIYKPNNTKKQSNNYIEQDKYTL